jgi:glutathione S-transferase
MSLTLHAHPLSSYCWKVGVALHEKDLPFELRLVADLRDPEARTAYAALWPTAKIPLLQDDGRFVPETSIQIEHLDLRFPGTPRMLPGDQAQQLDVRLWDRLFDLYVMTPMQRFVGQVLRPEAERDPAAMDEAVAALDMAYGLVESRMGEGPWIAGETFTLADCAAAPALFYAAVIVPFGAERPRLAAYFERLIARPSVARAIAEARPYFEYYPLRERLQARFLEDAPHAG